MTGRATNNALYVAIPPPAVEVMKEVTLHRPAAIMRPLLLPLVGVPVCHRSDVATGIGLATSIFVHGSTSWTDAAASCMRTSREDDAGIPGQPASCVVMEDHLLKLQGPCSAIGRLPVPPVKSTIRAGDAALQFDIARPRIVAFAAKYSSSCGWPFLHHRRRLH